MGRDAERLAACAGRCGKSHVVAVDLAAADAPQRIVEETIGAFGALTTLLHMAGIFLPKPLAEAPLEDFDEQWRVNVRAPYALTKAALPHLAPDSSVIFVSSIAGQVAFTNSGRVLRDEGGDRAADEGARRRACAGRASA